MKAKQLLPLILLCMCTQWSHAQWRVGASAGADYNHYSINTQYQTDFRYAGAFGWSASVFGQYNFQEWFGLRVEAEAMQRNYRFYRTDTYADTDYTTLNTYMQVPVLAQFSFGPSVYHAEAVRGLRGFVNIGCYAGYWMTGWQKGTWFDSFSGQTMTINRPYDFQEQKDQRADFGLAGGIGLEYRFSEHWAMHLEGRCYYSILSTVKPYMRVKDNRYNTTVGLQAGFSYIF